MRLGARFLVAYGRCYNSFKVLCLFVFAFSHLPHEGDNLLGGVFAEYRVQRGAVFLGELYSISGFGNKTRQPTTYFLLCFHLDLLLLTILLLCG